MKKIKLFFAQKRKIKGQSLMEMTVVLFVLLLLLLGTVEFGNLLNQYISLVDGVRAGARFGSNNDPFEQDNGSIDYTKINDTFYTSIDYVIDGESLPERPGAIGPLILKKTDQVMITFLSVRGGTGQTKSLVTYPTWLKYKTNPHQVSKVVGTDIINSSLQKGSPNTGFLVVEIFYDYNQLLSMPIFTAIVPDPIPVHTYAIMPLSAAEPTPVVVSKPSPIAQ